MCVNVWLLLLLLVGPEYHFEEQKRGTSSLGSLSSASKNRLTNRLGMRVQESPPNLLASYSLTKLRLTTPKGNQSAIIPSKLLRVWLMVVVSVCAAAASMAWHSGFVQSGGGWRVFVLAVVSGAPAAVAKKIQDAAIGRDRERDVM